MKITFIGATHEVTGSCSYIDACGKRFLVDFGMEQGEDCFENVQIPVSPSNPSSCPIYLDQRCQDSTPEHSCPAP